MNKIHGVENLVVAKPLRRCGGKCGEHRAVEDESWSASAPIKGSTRYHHRYIQQCWTINPMICEMDVFVRCGPRKYFLNFTEQRSHTQCSTWRRVDLAACVGSANTR